MSSVPATPPRFRIKGRHVLGGVTAFFAVIIAVDATFAVIAVRTFPGQVSVTPYEDGLIYNRHLAQMSAQDRLGWRAAAAAEPGQVALTFVDHAGRPLSGLVISGKLQRPATEAGRLQLRFQEAEPGRYLATTGRLSGAWDLTVAARGPTGGSFMAERRLTWP